MEQLRKGLIGCMETLKGNSRGEAQKILLNELLDWKGVCDENEKVVSQRMPRSVWTDWKGMLKVNGEDDNLKVMTNEKPDYI
ncbi:hypothetical protein GCK32_022877 [Trichostrongylus colubriformis]|uniref:Uncharacterized protein n=1 Tax=Trichostrongylus colubriformis TaxID=6319 RepID=A0AAN8EN55_TRICO